MVRTYTPKNRYEKHSKLTTEQTAYLFRVYFVPLNLDMIAKNAGLSRRTVETKLSRFNEFVLSDLECRSALIDYLQPESEALDWISRNEDLSAQSDFWERLHTCYFNCPAALEPALMVQQLSRFKAIRYIEEMETRKGAITMLKTRCVACPVKELRENVNTTSLISPKTFLTSHKRTAMRVFRSSFFRYGFYSAVTFRAGAAQSEAPEDEKDQAYRTTIDKNVQDLAIILAYHMTQNNSLN